MQPRSLACEPWTTICAEIRRLHAGDASIMRVVMYIISAFAWRRRRRRPIGRAGERASGPGGRAEGVEQEALLPRGRFPPLCFGEVGGWMQGVTCSACGIRRFVLAAGARRPAKSGATEALGQEVGSWQPDHHHPSTGLRRTFHTKCMLMFVAIPSSALRMPPAPQCVWPSLWRCPFVARKGEVQPAICIMHGEQRFCTSAGLSVSWPRPASPNDHHRETVEGEKEREREREREREQCQGSVSII
jgi:hypothetical protein